MTGAVVAIQQRLDGDDVSAHLSSKETYRHLNLPAIAIRDEVFPLPRGGRHARRIGDVLNPLREPQDALELCRRRDAASETTASQLGVFSVGNDHI